ncbi:hypothetical protein GEV43_34085 [Actinomadura sp. J1-007]|uniref:FG-GAP repeat protein n=1 Tax=Actinomadura sp. J1-007 TaxID=2661913 RepID=UPI001327602B|nr:FG-GAP repeat protein [Actinomadura sp. J1-007]MWK38579.1 hypothetical protein [Actinomadura sp. J1-007]
MGGRVRRRRLQRPQGPDPARRQIITHDCLDVPTRGEPTMEFGTTMESADFDHDGYDDLLVGGHSEGWGETGLYRIPRATIVYGGAHGLTRRAVELRTPRRRSPISTAWRSGTSTATAGSTSSPPEGSRPACSSSATWWTGPSPPWRPRRS